MNKKIVICLILMLMLIVLFVIFAKFDSNHEESTQSIINMIDKKETFGLVITTDSNFEMKPVMQYYEDTYSFPYKYLIKDDSELYNNLISRTNFEILHEMDSAFLVFKNGKAITGLFGYYTENHLKTLLTDNQVLDKKYKEIDYLVYDKEFNNFYKKDKLYNILYINENNEKLYDYRSLLVKYNVPSLVLYPSDVNSGNTSIMFNTELGIEADVYEKLPILIKIKNKNIVKSKTNVTLDEFEELIKE